MTKMVGKRQVGNTRGRMKTGPGECIFRVTRPNGECSQNLVSNPARRVKDSRANPGRSGEFSQPPSVQVRLCKHQKSALL